MEIKQQALAGTLESSDVLVEMIPENCPLAIELSSPVKAQFGEDILNTVREVMAEQGITEGRIRLEDRGALDCTIRARLLTCLERAQAQGGKQ